MDILISQSGNQEYEFEFKIAMGGVGKSNLIIIASLLQTVAPKPHCQHGERHSPWVA